MDSLRSCRISDGGALCDTEPQSHAQLKISRAEHSLDRGRSDQV